jgi:hypothetical protein
MYDYMYMRTDGRMVFLQSLALFSFWRIFSKNPIKDDIQWFVMLYTGMYLFGYVDYISFLDLQIEWWDDIL